MRTQYQPFDAIAREEIILKIYKKAKPLDSWSDNSTILLDPGTLSVDRIDDSVIEMQWFVDGSLIPTASGDTFNLADYGFGQGQYEVQARGFDPTGFDPVNGWVRKDQWRLEQFVDWEVTISVPEPTSGFLLVAIGISMAVCCRKWDITDQF